MPGTRRSSYAGRMVPDDAPHPDPDDGGHEPVPVDLIELHGILEWQRTVAMQGPTDGEH